MTLFLVAFVLAANPVERPAGSHVTLTGNEKTLGEVTAAIARQANIPIELDRAPANQPVALRFENVPFWEALERVAKASNHRLIVGAAGSRVVLAGGPENAFRPLPLHIDGPFRVSAS